MTKTVPSEAAKLRYVSLVQSHAVEGQGFGASRFIGLLCLACVLEYDTFAQTTTYPAGTSPYGIAFDGASIWVTNHYGNSVTKLRASDGTLLGTFPVGGAPIGITFDGTAVWVANAMGPGGSVTKRQASDGSLLGTFPMATSPREVLFDGANIWVSNYNSNLVTKLRASDGAALGTFPVAGPWGLAFDGANVWVTNFDGSSVSKMRASDGLLLGTFPVGMFPYATVFDGTSIWVASALSNTVSKLRPSDGVTLGTFPVGNHPIGLAFDGTYVWVTNASSDTVTKLRASDGMVSGTFQTGINPFGIAFDGLNMWVANFGGNSVTKFVNVLEVPVTITSNPPGRTVHIDGTALPTPQVFNWTVGGSHTIAATSPQNSGDSRYLFANWSDSGVATHAITVPATPTTLTASYQTQHLLTASASGGGAVFRSPSSGDGYYNAGTSVQVTATSAPGYQFAGWSGDLSGTTNPQQVMINAPKAIVANFVQVPCTFSVFPTSLNLGQGGGVASSEVSAPAGCGWTATSQASWITINSPSNGTGTGLLSYSVATNPGGPRTGTLLVAGTIVTVQQEGTPAASAGPLRFVPVTPCRLMETRPEYNFEGRTGAFGPPFMRAGETRSLTLATSNVCSIPATAKAYVLNVTVVPRGPVDFVTVWPSGEVRPDFWTVRSPDGQIVANQAILKSGSGAINVFASNDTDMVIDISGYFIDQVAGTNLVFYPLTPCRVIDTRIEYRSPAGPFGPPTLNAGETRRFRFPQSPHCPIPAGASAYSVTLTVVPSQPLAYMTLWPAGGPRPNVSSINSFTGRILANNVIVPASSDGSIDVFASDRTDFLVDINGYLAPDNGTTGLYFNPVRQCRVSDSRGGSGYAGALGGPRFGDDERRTLPLPDSPVCPGLPRNAQAWAVNVTAMPEGNPMPFLTAWPAGQPRPNASMLNAFQGQTVANSAIVPAGPNGAIDIFTYRRTHVAVEVSGYFGR